MKKYNPEFKIGQIVRYSHAFLKSINADYDTSILTGIVQTVKKYPNSNKIIVKILWKGELEVRGSLTSNLTCMDYDVTE